jgi:hypothetical protein
MAWKGFGWFRAILCALKIVAPLTKGNGDDKVADAGEKIVTAAEQIEKEIRGEK